MNQTFDSGLWIVVRLAHALGDLQKAVSAGSETFIVHAAASISTSAHFVADLILVRVVVSDSRKSRKSRKSWISQMG